MKHIKYGPSRSGAVRAGSLLAHRLPYFALSSVDVIPLPTTHARVRERGFDQAVYMARGVSRILGTSPLVVLQRSGTVHQVGSSQKERLEHMRSAFSLRTSKMKETALLVDDVLTTGATAESAARLLKRAGYKRVVLAVICRTI